MHMERTRRLRLGQTLSEVTADICRRLGIGARVVPMSDDRVRTRVRVDWVGSTSRTTSYASSAGRSSMSWLSTA